VSTPTRPRRVDGSMSLLTDMMWNTLDEAYADRAARRSEEPQPLSGRAVAAALLVLLGLVTGTAVAQVRARAEASTGLRADLAEAVRERTAESDRLEASAEQLRAEVAATQAAALGVDAEGRAAADRLVALGLGSGTVPVEGPGVVVTLDDAPPDAETTDGQLRGGTPLDGRVQDRDLQDLVNGLWAAGAEAISINGQRLTALTAIRSAGDAVLVDFRPLSPPYVVRAVGDPSELEVGLLDGPAGRRLATYVSLYGIGFEVRRADELALAGAAAPSLRFATPVEPVQEGDEQ
jgi:uncharacterized protein YlxW (UPF0749 family)